MGSAGFDYIPVPANRRDWDSAVRLQLERLTFSNRELVEVHGYHWMDPTFGDDVEMGAVDNLVGAGGDSRNEGYEAVYNGPDGQSGCLREVNHALVGPGRALMDLDSEASRLHGELMITLRSSESLNEIRTKWSRCMASQGYLDRSIVDGERVVRFLADAVASAAEIEEARADFECRAEIGYGAVYLSTLSELIDKWLSENLAIVQEFRATRESDVRTAKEQINK